jgi:hypothetical protein
MSSRHLELDTACPAGVQFVGWRLLWFMDIRGNADYQAQTRGNADYQAQTN